MYSKRWHRTWRADVLKEVAPILGRCLLKETPLIACAHLFEMVAPVTVYASTQEVGIRSCPGGCTIYSKKQ